MDRFRRLRIARSDAFPLRLRELIIEGRPAAAASATHRRAATLSGFLDVAGTIGERIAQALARVGLSRPQYDLLERLRDAGDAVAVDALDRAVVDELEAEGLVRTVPSPAGIEVELTALGRARAAEGATQVDEVRAHFAASLTSADRVQLGRLLAKLA